MDEKFYEHKPKVGWYRKSVLNFGKCSGTDATESAVAYRCQERTGSPASTVRAEWLSIHTKVQDHQSQREGGHKQALKPHPLAKSDPLPLAKKRWFVYLSLHILSN